MRPILSPDRHGATDRSPLPRVIALLCLALVLAACGGAGDGTSSRTTSAPLPAEQQYGRAALKLGGAIAELRGHYIAAKELYAAGDLAGAKVHADHPVQELYRSFRQAIAERDAALDRDIRQALDQGVALIDRKAPASEFSARVDQTAAGMMDRALRVAHPSIDPAEAGWRSAMAAAIINTAAAEYVEAAPKGKLELVAEYQDSYGFAQHSQALVGQLGDLGGRKAEVDQQFATLKAGAYKTGAKAPTAPVPAAQVQTAVDRIVAALEAAAGRKLLLEEQEPVEELKAIARGLDQTIALYRQGDRQQALDTAAALYTDRFEGLEADIAAENPTLMADLERRISVGIRDVISGGGPVTQLETQVAQIKKLLPEAEKALGGSGQTSY